MKIDNSFNEKNIYNTTSANNSDALSKVKFRNILAELLASTETTDEEEDTTKKTTTASLAGGIGAFPMMGMRMMPPPPPETGKVDLEELIEKALAAGKITAEQAEEYKALLAEMDESNADEASAASLAEIFQILHSYLPTPGSESDEEVSGVQKTPEEMEEQRLADLEEAIEKAKSAGELTDEQYTLISEFLANQKSFLAMMIELGPDGTAAETETDTSTVASIEETTDSTSTES